MKLHIDMMSACLLIPIHRLHLVIVMRVLGGTDSGAATGEPDDFDLVK